MCGSCLHHPDFDSGSNTSLFKSRVAAYGPVFVLLVFASLSIRWVWWYRSTVPVLRGLMLENPKFKVSLSRLVRPCLKEDSIFLSPCYGEVVTPLASDASCLLVFFCHLE